jgi:hypothetical protein
MDVNKTGILKQLACVLVVGDRALNALSSTCKVFVPLRQRAVRGKRVIDTPGLQIDFDVLYPTLAGLQMTAKKLAYAGKTAAMGPVREDFLIQVRPARDATTSHAQVDQVERLFTERPWALVVAWDAKSQIGRDPKQTGQQLARLARNWGTYFSG